MLLVSFDFEGKLKLVLKKGERKLLEELLV